MSKDTGGQAFPRTGYWTPGAKLSKTTPNEGMTLRDYFIAHAPHVPDWFKPVMLKDRPKEIVPNVKWDDDLPISRSNKKELDEYNLEYRTQEFSNGELITQTPW